MLDSATKRRIDTARDILVGKVPDPKSQVEQITIALIYKFMDDMDAEAEEMGGKRKFFTGDYARYGWAKLMSPGIGGYELIGLYGEGIATMPQNPGIPALFRDMFKAHISTGQIRHTIGTKDYTDLATDATFSTRDLKTVPAQYRTLIPNCVKDQVPQNLFSA